MWELLLVYGFFLYHLQSNQDFGMAIPMPAQSLWLSRVGWDGTETHASSAVPDPIPTSASTSASLYYSWEMVAGEQLGLRFGSPIRREYFAVRKGGIREE